nr:hypothetical protein [Lysobacter segetis]
MGAVAARGRGRAGGGGSRPEPAGAVPAHGPARDRAPMTCRRRA